MVQFGQAPLEIHNSFLSDAAAPDQIRLSPIEEPSSRAALRWQHSRYLYLNQLCRSR